MSNCFSFFVFLSFLSGYLLCQEYQDIIYEVEVCQQDSITNFSQLKQVICHDRVSDNRIYFEKIPIKNKDAKVEVSDFYYVNPPASTLSHITQEEIADTVRYNYFIGTEKKKHYLFFYLEPFRRINNYTQQVSRFKIKIKDTKNNSQSKAINFINNSILSTGSWYKLGATNNGVHVIDSDFLLSIGVNPSEINPKNIRIYGNEAGSLEEGTSEIDDLKELAIEVVGEDDGSFDNDDYILFYGESPDVWTYDNEKFTHKKNIYSETTYYFLCFDLGLGKRIETIPVDSDFIIESSVIDQAVSSYDAYFFHEEDLINLVNTGRQWFGEAFSFDSNRSFSLPTQWHMDNVLFTTSLAARSSYQSSFSITQGSNNIGTVTIDAPSSDNYYTENLFVTEFFLNPLSPSIVFNYNNNGNTSAEAWLDYFSLQGRSDINYNSGQLLFRDTQSMGQDVMTYFSISSSLPMISTWDVSDPLNVQDITLTKNNQTFYFKTSTTNLKEFLVFNDITEAITPQFIEFVPNQNIHGADQPTYIIVTHPLFINAAHRLANYHNGQNNENVLVVTTKQVYNEFSTGSQDIGAIRNLVKMFYDRAESTDQIPKNLLLFGDASFDYQNKLYGTSNYVPTYQSLKSSSLSNSYCTDDYFGVLDDNEGAWNGGDNYADLIDIGIGRIPVSSVIDADLFIDKILSYNSLQSRGDWKNIICFVADDADENWEWDLIDHADALASKVDSLYPTFNVNKIYLDSYEQSIGSGSQRYPDAQNALRTQIEEGALIINYVGHGGEIGLASERVLELSDINEFSNINSLPVFITATCEFTRYDDPTRVSAGEYLLLNPNGGAIGLYSTSRTVGESPTYRLVNALYNYLPDQVMNYTFGESICYAKNDPALGTNSIKRKFSFFGDPHLKLAYPKFGINTTSIVLLDSLNQPIISEYDVQNDTIKSLSHVRVSGEVIDDNDDLVDFSGALYVSVFDKADSLITLNNDGTESPDPDEITVPYRYSLQKNIIYNGSVDVVNGYFSFEFIVPKDIGYQYNKGKFSYYATDPIEGEASGFNTDVVIGGASDNFVLDSDGPDIQLFMNDTNFVSGGYTNSDPELLAILFDESGINTVGTGIGHNLTAVLDQNVGNQHIVNSYYDADFNSFQSGKVRYPFYDLSDGEHTLIVKAWDVHNNSNTSQIIFFVTSSSTLAIEHLLNYPNPSSSFTRFVFEHNRPNEELNVNVDIFSLNGRLVKTLSSTIFTTGFREESISWDIDSSIDPGIYLYRLSVKSQNDDSIAQKTEKLIIVR